MKIHEDYYLVVDLEATCSQLSEIPRHQMEIIEIGAVMLPRDGGTVVSEFQTFIKPVRHPILTNFCKDLTSIRQDDVDQAPTFAEAMQLFAQWYEPFESVRLSTWGNYDKSQFLQDCQYHGVDYPFGEKHLNLKKAFAHTMGLNKSYGMARALMQSGLPLEGTHHRGIDDARNIARLVQWMLERQESPAHQPVG